MRILELNIDSFGKLENYNLKFDQKLTIINEDNSFGKTTIAQFIKAMFFGMKTAKGKGKDYHYHALNIYRGVKPPMVVT